MDSRDKYKVIGVMSGTSLDGVDLACCTFRLRERKWLYSIDAAQTVRYSADLKNRLARAQECSGLELAILDREFGRYIGVLVHALTIKYRLRGVDFVASHGHTVFHQPNANLTLQIGSGYEIHAATGLPVVYDFRSLDVVYGGQGAPLVPIGDKHLFHEYDCCLNLGGIANISFDVKGRRRAYDICYANMALNYLAELNGQAYDKNGQLASQGTINATLLAKLNACIERYSADRPSLRLESFDSDCRPLLDKSSASLEDKMATAVESIGHAILHALPPTKRRLSILCTGGGTWNSYLMYRLMEILEDRADLIIPEPEVVDFKEAMIFGFLGVLRARNEPNTLKQVTGAFKDSSGGLMIGF